MFGNARPQIMGILNLTPDSFSDGGQFDDHEGALRHAEKMVAEGADIVDIGGESTRPGSTRVSAEEQIRRIVEPIRRLRARLPSPVRISVDTTLASVAAAALDAGADIVNDTSAGRDDPEMFRLVAARGAEIILMHMQGTPATMQDNPHYADVVAEVRMFLLDRSMAAQACGIASERIAVDPGIGFGKSREHNLTLLASLHELTALGYPLLLGCSRKRFMGNICQVDKPGDLVAATCATTALGVMAGVRCFRVHDVQPNRQAADVAWAIKKAGST